MIKLLNWWASIRQGKPSLVSEEDTVFLYEGCSLNFKPFPVTDKNVEMRVHNDTIRDVIFVPHSGNEMLVSGGADKKIVVTDCGRATAVKEYSQHTAAVLSLYSWSRSLFVSGSGDKTCRLWDLRQANSTKVIHQKNGCPG